MYVASLSFEAAKDHEGEEATDAINVLLGALRLNGQILGREFPFVETECGYQTFLMLPAEDSLEPSRANRYVARGLEPLSKAGLKESVVELLGESPDSQDLCACSEREFFILFTTYLSLESPLRCGACFGPVPLYSVPPTVDDEFHDVMAWQSDYQACDQLQMNCQTGERFGLREMSRHDSSLSERGRAICKKIEAGTGTPTYYYLHRYNGKSVSVEQNRRCPSCGGAWRLEGPLHDLFHFKCDRCCLLSNIAFNLHNTMAPAFAEP